MSSLRVDYVGHKPVVERRHGMYFVVFDDLDVELAMAFLLGDTAAEIAANCFVGSPFYTMIPCVPKGTPWPRREFKYYPLPEIIEHRTVD